VLVLVLWSVVVVVWCGVSVERKEGMMKRRPAMFFARRRRFQAVIWERRPKKKA